MDLSASDHLRERCQQWAEQTQELFRCPVHQDPNPFCGCIDVTGKRINGQIVYDGQWHERSASIDVARRRYHAWADQQRPEVQTRKQQFKQMIQEKHEEMTRFREWQLQWMAAGFLVISFYTTFYTTVDERRCSNDDDKGKKADNCSKGTRAHQD